MEITEFVFRAAVFIAGAVIVAGVVISAIETFVMPRSARDALTRVVFRSTRRLFDLRLKHLKTYEERDRLMAFYAPISLLALPLIWLTMIDIGYTLMYWASGVDNLSDAFKVSGSSLLTLGVADVDGFPRYALAFSEAAFGLLLVALLISYLPTMYAAFQRREAAVTLLEVRAGSPPWAIHIFERYSRLNRLDRISDLWVIWEGWFGDIEESHTSLGALSFFRSPQPDRSWVTSAGAVLDAAALALSTVDLPSDPQAALCIRAGFLALRRICDFFGIKYNPAPLPTDPISIKREEFDAACQRLAAEGIALKPDLDQAWRDFAGWRVNYDTVLLALCALTMAPEAPWSSDRARRPWLPSVFETFRRKSVGPAPKTLEPF